MEVVADCNLVSCKRSTPLFNENELHPFRNMLDATNILPTDNILSEKYFFAF